MARLLSKQIGYDFSADTYRHVLPLLLVRSYLLLRPLSQQFHHFYCPLFYFIAFHRASSYSHYFPYTYLPTFISTYIHSDSLHFGSFSGKLAKLGLSLKYSINLKKYIFRITLIISNNVATEKVKKMKSYGSMNHGNIFNDV